MQCEKYVINEYAIIYTCTNSMCEIFTKALISSHILYFSFSFTTVLIIVEFDVCHRSM